MIYLVDMVVFHSYVRFQVVFIVWRGQSITGREPRTILAGHLAPPTAYGSVHAFPKCLLSGEHHDDFRVFGFCFSPLNVERKPALKKKQFFVTVPAPCCPIDGSERSSQAAVNDLIAEHGALSNRQSERVLCFLFCFCLNLVHYPRWI